MRLLPRFLAVFSVASIAPLALAQSNPSFEIKQSCAPNQSCGLIEGATAADFNNDGKPDLLTEARVGNGELFSLQLGNGDGTFQPSVAVAASSQTSGGGLLAIDLNHDGILDLVSSSYGGHEVDVFFGTGGGAFGKPVALPTPGYTFANAVTGDFNGDGQPDIAIGDSSGQITIFSNNGNGSFAPATSIPVGAHIYINSLAAGDLDHDGKTDLAVTDSTNNAYVLWGLGGNSFHQVLLNTYPFNGLPSAAATIGDLNQNGSGDLLISYNCNPIPISPTGKTHPATCTGIDAYYGQANQSTSFHHLVTDTNVDSAQQLMPVDVNGDGIADLVAGGIFANNTREGLVVWLGHPDGSFDPTGQPFTATSNGGGPILAEDFNRDGRMDFFQLLNGSAAFYFNATSPAACAASRVSKTVLACQPVDNTYLAGPLISVAATAYNDTPITALQEYADGELVYSRDVTGFNVTLRESPGPHVLVTKAWDASGNSFTTTRHVTVYSGVPGSVCAAATNAVSLCLPSGAPANAPVHILASSAIASTPTAAQLYIDGRLLINDTTGSASIDTTQSLASGSHLVEFKLWSADGTVHTASKTLTLQ